MQPRFGTRPICSILVALATMSGPGCAMFPNWTLSNLSELQTAEHAAPAPQDAIALELFFIERPPGDPLIGDALWNELDQIGSLSPEVRARLRMNGVRFGLAGSTAPYALNSLMNAGADAGLGRRTLRQEYQMPSGVSHLFSCSQLPSPATVEVDTDGKLNAHEYVNARGVLRCRVERSQPGWALIDVLPEIHHGQLKMRPQATDDHWDWSGGQEIEALYPQRFSVELNEGEALVLGATGSTEESLGSRFFRSTTNGENVEKLLVIRLSRIDQVRPKLQTHR